MQKMDLLIGQQILIIKNPVVSIIQIRTKQKQNIDLLGRTGTTGTYKTWLGLSDSILKL